MSTSKKMNLVYTVILLNPGVQNDENALYAAVWQYEGWSDVRSLQENLRNVTNAETISRCRRKLHEQGLITYTPVVEEKRYEAFVEERNEQSSYTQARFI